MTKHKSDAFFQGPVWSVLVVDSEGNASFDRVGLTQGKARQRVSAILKTKVGKTHQVIDSVAPPSEKEKYATNGSCVVVYVLGGWGPCINAIGLGRDEAESYAKRAIEKYGPGTPRAENSMMPYIVKTFVIESPEIMEMVGLAVPS